MRKILVYNGKTEMPHYEIILIRSCKKLLFLLPKFLYFLLKLPFTGGGIDNKTIIKEKE